jgi:hypothetical protein
MKTRLLSLLIAATLTAGAAQASEPPTAPPAPTAQQQAAREEIDRLVARIQELSKQLGEGNDVRVIVRRMDGEGRKRHEGMPHDRMMMHPDMDHDVIVERVGGPGGADGPRKIRIERRGPGGMSHDGMKLPMGEGMMRHRMGPGPGLGIVMSPNTAAAGVKVAAVSPDSPAQKADLRAGDVILSVDGKSVGGGGTAAVEKARELLGELKKGQVVALRVARQGKTLDKKVTADDIGKVVMINRGERMPGMRHHGMMLPDDVQLEIERLPRKIECKKGQDDCGMPVLFQAFRWQGLNLASVDAGLGRYFGTDKGVLVLSAGPDLKGLQSGDVIQRVGGATVDSPRDVMRALRDKDEGAQLKLDVLRERKPAAVTLTVPKSRPLPFMDPPAPPAAPPPPPGAVPRTPGLAPPAPPAAPAPPPKPAAMEWQDEDGAHVLETRHVDADGNEQVERVVTVQRQG